MPRLLTEAGGRLLLESGGAILLDGEFAPVASAPTVAGYTAQAFPGAYPYNCALTHSAAGASALVVVASTAGGYSWDPKASFDGVDMPLLARSTSAGGQGTIWVFGLAAPAQVSGTVRVDRRASWDGGSGASSEYGDIGVVSAINISGTAASPFGAVAALHGTTSVTPSVTVGDDSSLLLGVAHDHYTSSASMTTPAGATAIFSETTNTNHQQFGFSRLAGAGVASMQFSTTFNSVGAVLVAIRAAVPREKPKPSGTLTVSKTGQYSGLRALYAFNEASGDAVNLAQPSDALVITGGSRADDAVGRHFIPGGTALSTFTALAKTNVDLNLGATESWTLFVRCEPPQFSEGVDRTLLAIGSGSAGGIEINAYGTIYEAYAGGWVSFGERPATGVQTLVVTYTPGTLQAYANGTAYPPASVTLSHVGSVKLSVGHDQRAAFSSFANKVYEVGVVAGVWTAEQVAAYDADPLGALADAPEPVNTDLIPDTAATGSPILGSPVLTEQAVPISLTASSVSTAAPVPGSASITQQHLLATTERSTGTPAAAPSGLTQSHVMAPVAAEVQTPTVDGATLVQGHVLAAAPATIPLPVSESPLLSQGHDLVTAPAVTEAPVAGSAVLHQVHDLTGQSAEVAAPVAGSAGLTQIHVLVGSPAILGNPVAEAPDAWTSSDLVPLACSTGVPAIDPVVITQVHALAPSDASTGAIAAGTAALSLRGELAPQPVAAGTPETGRPAITQIHGLTPQPVSAVPTASAAVLKQHHDLTAVPVETGAPAAGRPLPVSRAALEPLSVTALAPTADRTSLSQIHALAPILVTVPRPVVERPVLRQDVRLTIANLSLGLLAGKPVLNGRLPTALPRPPGHPALPETAMLEADARPPATSASLRDPAILAPTRPPARTAASRGLSQPRTEY